MDDHEDGHQQRNSEAEKSSWLWHWHHGVDKAVHDSTCCCSTDQLSGQPRVRIGQQVQECHHEEGQNVFQVVTMGPVRARNWIGEREQSVVVTEDAHVFITGWVLTCELVPHPDRQLWASAWG